MDKVFKALADSSRRQLLDSLFQSNGQTLTELVEHLDMSRQATTKHLRILEDADLITVVWKGRMKHHYLNSAPIGNIYNRWIGKFDQNKVETLTDMKNKLEEEKDE